MQSRNNFFKKEIKKKEEGKKEERMKIGRHKFFPTTHDLLDKKRKKKRKETLKAFVV